MSQLQKQLAAALTQQRHKPPITLPSPRPLVVACAQMQSGVNLSQIVRMAGNCGLRRMIACGPARIERKIAREAADTIFIERRRSLLPALQRLRKEGFELVALEQTEVSQCLFSFEFSRKTALVIGNERAGLPSEVLTAADRICEIPVYGLPYSYNAATAATLAMYEYCRQHPRG